MPTLIQKPQLYPTSGSLAENMNLSYQELADQLSGAEGAAYSYVVKSVYMDDSGQHFEQYGSAPNFQGGRLTLCTCKHQMRTNLGCLEWPGTWVAGFTSRRIHDGRHWLFYLTRVQKAYESHAGLWDSLPAGAREKKSTEVWILAINIEPLWPNGMSHWDIHQKYRVWWDYKEHSVRPLYIAFRVGGVLDSVCRVSRVEHAIPIVDVVPEMQNIKKPWPKLPATIWHFGPPVPLAKPLRTGAGMYNRRVRCDLDLLLTCETVQEIEEAMGKRRDQPEE